MAAPEHMDIAMDAVWRGAYADATRLTQYRSVCGLADTGRLPPLYLHAMAMPLHMAIMSHPQFPLRLLGLVHLSNRMQCLRSVGSSERVDMACQLQGIQATERGQTFTLHTRARAGSDTVWRETSTFLAPLPRSGKRPPMGGELDWGSPVAHWAVAGNAGRRFAVPSSDWNPIHISALTARLFGYPRAIAHGMFSAARCVDLLCRDQSPDEPLQIDLRFKRPLLIPGEVALHTRHEAAGTSFVLTIQPHGEPHIEGTLRKLSEPLGT
ncbi:MAG: MaoC/PaaZ C-terminal domain-containing protein [Rhodoferax sp.]|nr:MaoC/PaaZ C-terminal domain-containing protein [Rhodoferax sp.]